MTPDFPTYLLATALLSGALGFFFCGILCARQIRRAELEGWKEATRIIEACQIRRAELEGWKEATRFYAAREHREPALKNGSSSSSSS